MRIALKMICSVVILCAAGQAIAQDVGVQVGAIKDTRTTDKSQSELVIDLQLVGKDVKKVASVEFKATKAVDSTGKNLVRSDEESEEFGTFNHFGTSTISLKNPARKATTVKEISGKIEMVVPDNDPDAAITVTDFVDKPRTVVSHPSLSAAKAKITVLTKEGYQQEKKATEKKAAEKKNASNGQDPAAAMAQAFDGMFGGMGEPGDNGIVLKVEDPGEKVVKIEFCDAAGKPLRRAGSMSSGDTHTYNFAQELPKDTQIRFIVATQKAAVTIPFTLKDVLLP